MSHPIVAQMQPSPEQEPAVAERGRDIVVTAGAGTGKTRTLVARYLSLLADGLPLRSILAITFTRKAAREMRNRVREEVRTYLERTDLSAEERARWQALYAELDAARIGTIHSLCSEILRAHPAEARVDPRFDVLLEGQLNILQNRVLDEAMAWAADDEQAVHLFALLGERGLRNTLGSLLGQRLEAETCLASTPDPLWPSWESQLVPPIRAFVDDESVHASFDDLLALRDDGTLDRAEAAGDRLALPLRELLSLWDGITLARRTGDWPAVSVRLAPLRDQMKLVGRADNWRPADPKAILRTLQQRYDDQLSAWVGKGINLTLDVQLAEAIPDLQRLFEYTAELYQRLKQELRALDFDDLEHRAVSLLEQDATVRERWQHEIRAILVDEFQDTNGRQRDLVQLLNGDRGRLFIVGDGKQSIYRFRGADVTVFRAERVRIQANGGAAYPLDKSYRAHQDLIAGLNELLRPVLGENEDPTRPWVEPFAPLLHHREEPSPGFVSPHIELHLTVGSKSGGALDRAADALAGRIVTLMGQSLEIVDGGAVRPLDYGDFVILCRSSYAFGAYEDALDRAGVPFLTVAGRGFYSRGEIRDLLNALQAIADPTDDLALVGLLRSPAFGLSDTALDQLCQARSRIEDTPPLWDVLNDVGSSLSDEDGHCAERARVITAELHNAAGRAPVADLLKALLDATDYRAALIQAGQTRGARNVAKLLADAHASGIVGVGEFLEYTSGLRETGTREGEARATAEGAVQIMSVHAAKGLEFPIVIIGDATYGGGRGGSTLIDPQLGLLLPLKDQDGTLSAIYRLGKNRDDDQDQAESDRLLYVAATRAREKLMLSGCISLVRDGSVGKLGGWLGRLAGSEGLDLVGRPIPYEENGLTAVSVGLQVGHTPVACVIYEPGYLWDDRSPVALAETVSDARLPPTLLETIAPDMEIVDQRTSVHDRIPPQRVWRVVPAVKRPRAPAWVIGSLVHEALAAWRFPATDRSAGFERWAGARAQAYGVTDAQQLDDAIRQCQRLLLRFSSHPLYREMNDADRRLHEVPYSLPKADGVESGIIDSLYLREGVWSIVEFKTDRVTDRADLQTLLTEEDYLAQAERYAAATERLLGVRPRFILCMLNYAGAVRLIAPDIRSEHT
ncbi:MAG: UvrD-helicase domain-containing protein [Anaerolineae bacterium]